MQNFYIIVIMNKLTNQDRNKLEEQLRKSRDVHERDRLRVILARDDGLKPELIAQVLRLSIRSVFGYVEDWEKEGKTQHEVKPGAEPRLSKEQEEELIQHLEGNVYLRVKDVIKHVKQKYRVEYHLSGMTKWLKQHEFVYKKPKRVPGKLDVAKQEVFIKAYEELKETIAEDEEIYFSDATHPQHQSQEAFGWIRKGETKTLPTTGKQERLHFAGAISLKKMKIVVKEYATIDRFSIIDFFKHLEESTKAHAIHVICDNGTAYKNKDVEEYLKTSKIKIHYLPPYSPNLNPIERLWKVLREHTCYNRYYENFSEFGSAVRYFLFEKIPKVKNLLKKRINDNFQRIHLNPFNLAQT
jgi:transposase